jgi:hypothetical protein
LTLFPEARPGLKFLFRTTKVLERAYTVGFVSLTVFIEANKAYHRGFGQLDSIPLAKKGLGLPLKSTI